MRKLLMFVAPMFLLLSCSSDMEWGGVIDNVPNRAQITLSLLSADGKPLEEIHSTRGQSLNSRDDLTSVGLFALRYPVSMAYTSASASDYIFNDPLTQKSADEWTSSYSWPGSANKVSLFAYAPFSDQSSSTNSIVFSPGVGAPRLTYTVPTSADDNPDVIVAEALDLPGNSYEPVPMTFNHICARVRLCFYNGTPASVTFKYFNNTGTYTFGSGWTDVRKTTDAIEWTHTFSYPVTDEADTPDELTYYFPPQTVPANAKIEVTYADGTTETLTQPASAVWQAGETYEYILATANGNYSFTGCPQVFYAPEDGTYQIECWGAQGGGDGSYLGGRGGYTSGNLVLVKGERLYIHVGQMGQDNTTIPYNNGFKGERMYPSGGGSTDVRLESGDWKSWEGRKSRIMVAGAGGAAVTYYDRYNYRVGGAAAGGLNGYNGTTSYHPQRYDTSSVTGGTQTSGGYNSYNGTYGGFGIPNFTTNSAGNGYYAGGNAKNGSSIVGSGGGGSSFISGYSGCNAIAESSIEDNIVHTGQPNHYSGKVFTNTVMKDGATSMTSPSGTTETGHTGNGYCRITKL